MWSSLPAILTYIWMKVYKCTNSVIFHILIRESKWRDSISHKTFLLLLFCLYCPLWCFSVTGNYYGAMTSPANAYERSWQDIRLCTWIMDGNCLPVCFLACNFIHRRQVLSYWTCASGKAAGKMLKPSEEVGWQHVWSSSDQESQQRRRTRKMSQHCSFCDAKHYIQARWQLLMLHLVIFGTGQPNQPVIDPGFSSYRWMLDSPVIPGLAKDRS